VKISEPRNNFALVPAKKVLLLAGGIGITPLICMADWLCHTGVEFELHYCTRSAERTAFRNRIAASPFASFVNFHYDDGEEKQKLNMAEALRSPMEGTHLYVCGPGGFIDAVLKCAKAQGWADSNAHREYFNAVSQASAGDREFQVKLLDGRVFTIPADESVTTALARHGVHIPVSCELGVCGTCLTRVREGEPDHRDMYLTDEERSRNDRFAPCCSRAKSPMLALDL
jgi:vanillate O-demethylase ferredoxin subunit